MLEVIRWLDRGTFPREMVLSVPKSLSDLPDTSANNWMPMHGESLAVLKGNVNSYRAQLIAKLIGMNIDKTKLLSFAKVKDYEYSLDTQSVVNLCDKVLFTIKVAVVIHFHNLKVAEFDSLVGLFFNAKSADSVYSWVDCINHSEDIFKLDKVSKDGFMSNL